MDTEIKATAKAEGQPVAMTNTDKAAREIAEEMARRDRKQYPNAETMPSIQYYEEKAREAMSLVVPYVRPYLTKRESGWPKSPASAINALIGYLSALKPGEVVTHEYITRLNEHYIPVLEKRGNE